MANKPEIQYVERFYVSGTAALSRKELKAQKKAQRAARRMQRPQLQLEVDVGAIFWTAAAAVLCITLLCGFMHLSRMCEEREIMQSYVENLQLNNTALKHNYRISYNLEDIQKMAEDQGLVPEDQVETRYIRVTVPEHKEKWTAWGNIKWFFEGLFE